jgi:hypothetical protein
MSSTGAGTSSTGAGLDANESMDHGQLAGLHLIGPS